MPSASKIRKEVLLALNEGIIPALQTQQVGVGVVAPPFEFPPSIRARLINKTAPQPDGTGMRYPVQAQWAKLHLHATALPYVGIVFEGVAIVQTLVTAQQAQKYQINKGRYAIRWQAPAALLFPPETPRNANTAHYYSPRENACAPLHILWFELRNDGVQVHTHVQTDRNIAEISHSLFIPDATLTQLISLFSEHLCKEAQSSATSQAILLAAMLRLRDYLHRVLPKIANTSRPATLPLNSVVPQGRAGALWREAMIFIQMNLHESLSVSLLARQLGISPAHLNRIFHQYCDMPVMRYVRLQRIEAARCILRNGTESINEIALLVGFSSASVFCTAFVRETGQTPKQFRHQAREKSTFANRVE